MKESDNLKIKKSNNKNLKKLNILIKCPKTYFLRTYCLQVCILVPVSCDENNLNISEGGNWTVKMQGWIDRTFYTQDFIFLQFTDQDRTSEHGQ